jgi:polyisoprenoid-binding protein YceI
MRPRLTRRRFIRTSVTLSAVLVPGVPWLRARASAQDVARYDVVPERSEVRYRVREQLVGLNLPNDAVGVTRAVEGGVALANAGRLVSRDSRFSVDLRQLRSDEPRRDNYVRRNTLETERYPTVVFVPTVLSGLTVPPPRTGTATFEILGDLTVRDVTRPVTWKASATFGDRDLAIRASTAFRFGDFGLRIPRVSVVLSVEDDIRLEADLALRRA